MKDIGTIAIHEAGHAVAHYRLGLEISRVSIIPDDHKETAGHLLGQGGDSVWDEAGAEKQVLAYLAGYGAVMASTRDEESAIAGTGSDMEEAADLIQGWALGDLNTWKLKAVEMMSDSANVRAVLRVAEELEERRVMDGELAKVLIDVADGHTTESELERYLVDREAIGKLKAEEPRFE